jgi:long-chain fatty acid transport protein
MKRLTLLLIGAMFASLLGVTRVHAGGLYLTDRGSRALGRGGAFVAGADDGQSLWYNPAGLSFTGRRQLHVDGTLSFFRGSFQRTTRDDVNGPPPRVSADASKLPIPTLAYSDSFGLRDWSFGVALMAPNAVMLSWPETAGTMANGMPRPGPTRYSLISMQGSAIANLAIGAAWHGVKGLSIGAGVHIIPARFRAGVYLNACDYGLLCTHPEDPDYEAPATIDLKRSITATPILGAVYQWDKLRVGASVMMFYRVGGTANLDVNLPNAPLFGEANSCGSNAERQNNPDCAHVKGNKADVGLDFPWVARFGAEVRPLKNLRVEGDIVYEGWSRQKDLTVKPKNISIQNALGIPLYQVGTIRVPRQMQDVFSLRLGGELQPFAAIPLVARMGFIYEGTAFPKKTLTPLTLDSQKALLSFGASFELRDKMFVDVLYAHLFMKDVTVKNSIVYPQNPLRPAQSNPSPTDPQPNLGAPEPIGNGHYAMEADLVGLGLRWNI